MKTLPFLSILVFAFLALTACNKESGCEMNNTGTLVIHNTSNKSKLWLTIDKSFGPGLSSADHQISAGETIEVELPAGIHFIEGVFTTPIGTNGVQMSGAEDKDLALGQCEEANVYYDL